MENNKYLEEFKIDSLAFDERNKVFYILQYKNIEKKEPGSPRRRLSQNASQSKSGNHLFTGRAKGDCT